MKRILLSFGFAALLGATASAFPAMTPPDQVVRETSDKLLALIRQHHEEYKKHPEKLHAAVNEILIPRFDWKYVSQLVLARYWRRATPEQRTRFQNALQNTLERSYADSMLGYTDMKVNWKPSRLAPEATDATVQSEVLQPGQPPTPINFALRLADGEWKVYDITIEGLSLVTNFRTQIAAQIKQDGLETVIKRLESGNANLATGTRQGSSGESRDDPQ